MIWGTVYFWSSLQRLGRPSEMLNSMHTPVAQGKDGRCLIVCGVTWLSVCLAICLPPVFAGAQGPSSLSLNGALFQPNGQPVSNSVVGFRVEVLDPAAGCVLYSEQHLGKDLSVSKGRFSFELGRGISRQNFIGGGVGAPLGSLTVAVFRNGGATGAFNGCAGGVTLAAGSERLVRVSYDIGSGFVAMTPNTRVASSAYAMVAETLGGRGLSEFALLRDDSGYDLNQANLEWLFEAVTNYPRLQALINGTSTQYLPVSPSASVDMNNQRVVNISTPLSSADAVNKSYADGFLGGRAVDMAGVGPATGNGRTLIWDQAGNRWTTASGGNATQLQSRVIASTAPVAGQALVWNAVLTQWEPGAAGNLNLDVNGNLALGTSAAGLNTRLRAQGQIAASSQSVSSAAIDFKDGNSVSSSFDCSTNLSLANLRDGGNYLLVVTNTSTNTCNFSTTVTGDDAATVSYRFLPPNGPRLPGTHAVYNLMRIGNTVYVSWSTGF
jgi:hypothetical protein